MTTNRTLLNNRKAPKAIWKTERKAAKLLANKKGLTFDHYQDFLTWAEGRGYNIYAV